MAIPVLSEAIIYLLRTPGYDKLLIIILIKNLLWRRSYKSVVNYKNNENNLCLFIFLFRVVFWWKMDFLCKIFFFSWRSVSGDMFNLVWHDILYPYIILIRERGSLDDFFTLKGLVYYFWGSANKFIWTAHTWW